MFYKELYIYNHISDLLKIQIEIDQSSNKNKVLNLRQFYF